MKLSLSPPSAINDNESSIWHNDEEKAVMTSSNNSNTNNDDVETPLHSDKDDPFVLPSNKGIASNIVTEPESSLSSSAVTTAATSFQETHKILCFFIHLPSWIWLVLILLMGMVITGGFVWMGINGASNEVTLRLEKQVSDLAVAISASFNDYELTALWIHDACGSNNRTSQPISCTRSEFTQLYETLQDTGLKFESLMYVPNVTHDQREEMELESQLYWDSLQNSTGTTMPYFGFTGFTDNHDDPSKKTGPRSIQPFYFPQHYLEPIKGNEFLFDFDLYSSYHRSQIDEATQNWTPLLSGINTLRHNDWEKQVLYWHPGSSLFSKTDYATSFVSMAIPFSGFMKRVVGAIHSSVSVYLFDVSTIKQFPDNIKFFGAVHLEPVSVLDPNNDMDDDGNQIATINFIKEPISFDELPNLPNYHRGIQADVRLPTTENTWRIVLIPDSGAYIPNLTQIIFGGVVIFVSFFLLTLCLASKLRRDTKFRLVKESAASEKAALMIKSAQDQARAEYELNEFLAHEVRNPLTAAMAACNFLQTSSRTQKSTTTKTSNVTEDKSGREDQHESLQDDIGVISSSLQYINDLLRSMLDLHKTANSQMRLQIDQTEILTDILYPVKAMLGLRSDDFDIIIDCPSKLVIQADRMRLKQVILNLASNSKKFVRCGFIRMHAYVGENGKVHFAVEDSGPGIPIGKRSNLFSRYQISLDRLNQGTGMGLSLCKSLVELMGGTINLDESYTSGVEGSPGARFVICLNITPEERTTERTSLTQINDGIPDDIEIGLEGKETGDVNVTDDDDDDDDDRMSMQQRKLPKNLSVLVVDDELVLRKLFMRSLKRVAPTWNIQQASNGESAISMTELETFDLIFMDQYMASVERQLLGTETVRALRAKGVVSSCICGLSANHMEDAFLEAGANAFMQKPFPCNADELEAILCTIWFDHSSVTNKD